MVSLALHNDCKSSWKPLGNWALELRLKETTAHTELKSWIEDIVFILVLVRHKQTRHNMYAGE